VKGTGVYLDCQLPTIALDATITDVAEFPTDLATAIVGLYHDYAKVLRAYELQIEAWRATLIPGGTDERLTEHLQKNFEVTRGVLLQVITRAIVASDEILPRLEDQAERAIMPDRRPRILPPG